MKSDKEILEQAKKEVHDGGNQSWNSIALVAIDLGKKDLFNYLQELAESDENHTLTHEFFGKMERRLF